MNDVASINLFDSKLMSINYPVRLHNGSNCVCDNKIIHKISHLKKQNNISIIYIIEKIWNDEIYKKFPRYVYIIGKKISEDKKNINVIDKIWNDKLQNNFSSVIYVMGKNIFKNANEILISLFHETIPLRRIIMNYFKNYKWCEIKSKEIRSIINKINTICFCQSISKPVKYIYNSGFIIIGNKTQIDFISHFFNTYIKPKSIRFDDEYIKLCSLKLANIKTLEPNSMGFNLKLFAKSSELHQINPELYTVVGLESQFYKKNKEIKYSFSFGKREWNDEYEETQFECAVRELYEEFNIQFSPNIYTENTTQPNIFPLTKGIMFILYLSEKTNVKFHKNSETIYLF